MNKFVSKMFFEDEFFTDDFVYTTLTGETYAIKCVLTKYWENNSGGNTSRSQGDWMDLSLQKRDIGFIPKIGDKLIDGIYTYNIKQIQEEGDCYKLSCEKARRTIK